MKQPIIFSVIVCIACAFISGIATGQVVEKKWPFSKPGNVNPPAVEPTEWVRNGIDAYILAKLQEQGLKPAPEAAKRTLIRRIYFDLIGLPPTPGEVDAFLNDQDPRAYELLVDRLLKDSRYGERWARFWLDLARYADTAGYEGDPDLPHAWRYRDYVIDALNNDKPYDLFIKEQIAGDEFAEILGAGDLPAVSPERVVALTFLRLAPFTEPRGDETRHEMLSEMTSTVGSVFLGLTVGCAKCHDHKHDDIPTKDFYRMKAFFETLSIPRPELGDGFQIGGPLPAKFYRPGEQEWAAQQRARLQKDAAGAKAELKELRDRLQRKLEGNSGFGLQALGGPFGNNHTFERRKVNDGKMHWTIVNSDAKKWQFLTDGGDPGPTGSLAESDEGDWFGDIPGPLHISLGQYSEGTGTPKQFGHAGHFGEILIYDHPLNAQERKSVGAYVRHKYKTGKDDAAAERVNMPPQDGLRFWIDAADLDANPQTPNPRPGEKIDAWIDKAGGVRLLQAETKLQPTMGTLGDGNAPAVRFDNHFLIGPTDGANFLSDQKGALIAVYSATHTGEGYGFEVGGNGTFISTFIYTGGKGGVLEAALSDRGDPSITAADRKRYKHLSSRDQFLPQHLKRLRPVAMSLRHSYGPPYEPAVPTSRVMIRGEFDNPGDVVKPGFLSCVTGNQKPAAIRLDPFKRWPTRSRRMALAKWIASPNNPLTARVMVNRLWYRHFGRGIVATPSDFGQLSGGPSHPELLDWLANRFVAEKWSVKAMHRLIVTSNTYRQTSRLRNKRAETIDPDNKLLWRFRRRRLEAEAIRDSVLAVSGRLNPEQFGLPIFPPLPGDIADRVKYSNSKWDSQYGPKGRKRSIYIYQQRTLMMPFMQVFDSLVCDESRPRRRTSTTPLQALAMYNGEFVNQEAGRFAQRVEQEAGSDVRKQIERAFQLALGRRPDEEELRRMTKLLASAEHSLVGLCRILYNSNEFVYVD
jgi:hypothetical protein